MLQKSTKDLIENDAAQRVLLSSIMPFPPVFWWQMALQFTEVWFDPYEPYQKRSLRNRYILAGSHGRQLLSVPLLGGRNQRVPIRDVCIARHDNWENIHWRTIQSFYGRAPFFEFFEEEIKTLFLPNREGEDNLYNWCFKGIKIVIELLGLDIKLNQSTSFQKNYPEKFQDVRFSISGRKEENDFLTYHQIFEERTGFIRDCSILDLLFCLGPEATGCLKS